MNLEDHSETAKNKNKQTNNKKHLAVISIHLEMKIRFREFHRMILVKNKKNKKNIMASLFATNIKIRSILYCKY